MELTFINDPGHGWLVVRRDIVDECGFIPSQFSFQDHRNYYLEEDCDATEFVERFGEPVSFNDMYVGDFTSYCMMNGIKRIQ